MGTICSRILRVETLETRLLLASYSVTSAADAGAGTLRAAIEQANANAGHDTIQFRVATGPQTVNLFTPLPVITSPVTIDGTTQPGFEASPIIELNGANTAPGTPGLRISAGSTTVRGLVIGGFPAEGIRLETLGGNRVEGNYIGTDRTGRIDRGNLIGIAIVGGSTGNIIGGTSRDRRNVISGNESYGIDIEGSFSANPRGTIIEGNLIGSSADGDAALGNGRAGIRATSADTGRIGGTAAGAGNVISANNDYGIELRSTRQWAIQGNFIGTDATGSAVLGTQGTGLFLAFSSANADTTIGGTTAAARNVIVAGSASGAGGPDGIFISENSERTIVQGNYIGLNAAGTAALGRAQLGIQNRGPTTLIGGTASGAGNVIAGCGTGIQTSGFFNDNALIQGNRIGTNAAGTAALPNAWGMSVGGENVTVGGAAPGAANLISGNTGYGIIAQSGPGVTIQGNRIGTTLDGTAPLPNEVGVYLLGAGHLVGGTAAGAGNLISGNAKEGVQIYGGTSLGASAMRIEGNRIGTNADGTAAVPNRGVGVLVDGGPGSSSRISGGAIGGTSPGAGNLISGNAKEGVKVTGVGAKATVLGNRIGTTADGAAPLGNASHGVWITASSSGNAVGGPAAGAGNVVAHNGGDGIFVESGTINTLRGNSIHSNAGLGIDLGPNGPTPNDAGDIDGGANNLLNSPVPSTAISAAGRLTVTGTFEGLSNATFTVDLYASDSEDATRFGEGQTYLGSSTVTTDADGNASLSAVLDVPAAPGTMITATVTDPAGSTSEFSRGLTIAAAPAVAGVYLSASQWRPAFRQFIAARGLGSADYGFAVAAGAAQLDEIPWTGIDRVSVRFSAAVDVQPGDLRILGANAAGYALDPATFVYSAADRTATWRLAAGRTFAIDRLLLDLDGVGHGADTTAGSDFLFRINLLPGDTNRTGSVLADDFSQVKRKFFSSTTNPGAGDAAYSVFHDIDGSGTILADDFSDVKRRFFDRLPDSHPAALANLSLLFARRQISFTGAIHFFATGVRDF